MSAFDDCLRPGLFLLFVVGLVSSLAAELPAAPLNVDIRKDILFAEVDGVELMLDLHLPEGVEDPPLVMFIHGGAWKTGDRKRFRIPWVVGSGYAVASIEYRMSHEAPFPAQIHDCKGALRWLRAHADEYGYNADKVVVAGTSAGGHLAALMGVSGGVAELEGTTAGHPERSSAVQGVIDYYGPTDFIMRSRHQPEKTDKRTGIVYQLLGGPVGENKDLARLASPVTHVGDGDPPLLIVHGEDDPVVRPAQSERLFSLYQQKGLVAELHIVPGKKHGWRPPTPKERKKVLEFLKKHLGGPGDPRVKE